MVHVIIGRILTIQLYTCTQLAYIGTVGDHVMNLHSITLIKCVHIEATCHKTEVLTQEINYKDHHAALGAYIKRITTSHSIALIKLVSHA